MFEKRYPPNNINAILKAKNIRQEGLGAAIGHSQQQVAKLANSERHLSDEVLLRMCTYLDAEPADLLQFDDNVPMEKIMVRGVAIAGVWRDKPFRDKEKWYLVELPKDKRFLGISRYGMEIEVTNGSGNVEIVTLVDVSKQSHTFEIGKRYLVQRRDDAGQYEICLRRLQKASDGEMWLMADPAEPQFASPIRYIDGSPTVKILALVTASYRTE